MLGPGVTSRRKSSGKYRGWAGTVARSWKRSLHWSLTRSSPNQKREKRHARPREQRAQRLGDTGSLSAAGDERQERSDGIRS